MPKHEVTCAFQCRRADAPQEYGEPEVLREFGVPEDIVDGLVRCGNCAGYWSWGPNPGQKIMRGWLEVTGWKPYKGY